MSVSDISGVPPSNITTAQAEQLLKQITAETAPERAAAAESLSRGAVGVRDAIERAEALLTRLDAGVGSISHHATALNQARTAQQQLTQLATLADLPTVARNHVRQAHQLTSEADVAISRIELFRGQTRYVADTRPVRSAVDAVLSEIIDGGDMEAVVRQRMFEVTRTLTSLETGDDAAMPTTAMFEAASDAVRAVDAAKGAPQRPKLRSALHGVQESLTRLRIEPALSADTSTARTSLAGAREALGHAVVEAEHGGILGQVDTLLGRLMQDIGGDGDATAKPPLQRSQPIVAAPSAVPTLKQALAGSADEAALSAGKKIMKTLL